jgi:hypothetical protein
MRLHSGNRGADMLGGSIRVIVLPNSNWKPTHGMECGVHSQVSGTVESEFRCPVGDIYFRLNSVVGASVPKAAVNEDRNAIPNKDQVGCGQYWAWKSAADSVSKTKPMECPAEPQLRLRAGLTVGPHHVASRR